MTPDDLSNLKPGDRVVDGPDVRLLLRRKTPAECGPSSLPGWWLSDGTGLADFALLAGWEVLPPFVEDARLAEELLLASALRKILSGSEYVFVELPGEDGKGPFGHVTLDGSWWGPRGDVDEAETLTRLELEAVARVVAELEVEPAEAGS